LNAQKLGISEQFQHNERDTLGRYGPIEVNGLHVTLGHKTAGLTKENAANLAGFNGVKDVVECVYLFGDYIAASPILAMHWGALV
jgi:hypothetical protein